MSPLTTPTTTAAGVRSSVPSPRVLRVIKPFVSMILRSLLHRLLSSRVLLLTFTGRKTGKEFTIPVGYTREGETLTLFSSRGWWKNLRGGAPVAARLRGRRRTGRAEVIEDRAAALAAAERVVARYGAKDAGRRIGLALDDTSPPSHDDLAAAMEGHAVIRLSLDPEGVAKTLGSEVLPRGDVPCRPS
jgi:deazaflavin-dependent oxidoreductase (nitroreductase family)